MVDRRLLLAAAEKAKVSPSDKELNEFLDKAYEQAGSKEKFLEMMKQRGVSEEEFFAGSRRDFQLMQFLDKKVFTEITIKDEELKEYYDKNPEMFVQPEEVSARHILVKVEEKASEADVAKAKEKAEAILAEVKKSPDKFADIAGEKSEGPSKARGGDLGFFSAGQMVKPFSDAAFAMKPGDISDLVKTQFGFHVIKVENRRGGDSVEYDKMKERIREFLTRQHQKEKLEMYVADLRKDSSVILYID
jgi:peptidyl-prolyl cis-trans isomerase C